MWVDHAAYTSVNFLERIGCESPRQCILPPWSEHERPRLSNPNEQTTNLLTKIIDQHCSWVFAHRTIPKFQGRSGRACNVCVCNLQKFSTHIVWYFLCLVKPDRRENIKQFTLCPMPAIIVTCRPCLGSSRVTKRTTNYADYLEVRGSGGCNLSCM